jgi:DNA modification methylase
LCDYLKEASDKDNPWIIPNAPVIQYKTAGGRVPIPGLTFRRSYELWLYAYRGGKQEYRMYPDVLECQSSHSENHGAAKPVELLKLFLSRSCKAGDSVLDFMAGSGGILIAAHELKVKCTAIEIGETNYGNCITKLKGLK